jgi:endonuclease/exonuclease/phosphatase (EEP) superfamily protein YafD
MIGKMVSLGFDLATLPARMTYRGTRAMLAMPGDIEQVMAEMRQVSDEVAREIQVLLDSVDAEMSQKAAHLSDEQKQQAADVALFAAQKHLSMAAVNVLRALWLTMDANRSLEQDDGSVVIEHKASRHPPGRGS